MVKLIEVFLSQEGGRCTLCPRAKGYRGVGRMTNVEQSMMAHLIVNHADNDDARVIITRKRYGRHGRLSSIDRLQIPNVDVSRIGRRGDDTALPTAECPSSQLLILLYRACCCYYHIRRL